MTDHRTLAQQANDATYDAWNAHDPDAVAAVFAEDAVLHDIANPDPVRGREAIRERAAGLLAAFSDFHLERVELIIDEDRHADRWLMTGTNDGELFGNPPTGRPVRIRGATFTCMNADGLVVEDHNLWDVTGLLAQLAAGT